MKNKLCAFPTLVFLFALNTHLSTLYAQVTFTHASYSVSSVNSFRPYSVAVVDINGDGKKDLASVSDTAPGLLSVLTNNGSGVFGLRATFNVGNNPHSVAAADINGDGKMDLISANHGTNTLSVYTNGITLSTFTFGLNATPIVGTHPYSVVAADINGDGKVDLISANEGVFPITQSTIGTLTVLTNNGSGSFGSNTTLTVGNDPLSVTAADINGDGKVDLISANGGLFANNGTLTVLTNNGSGSFGSNATLTVGSIPSWVTTADVRGNGKLDLISANAGDNTLSVLTNNGNGGFALASAPFVGDRPRSVTAADINGDGKMDLISANELDDTLSVLTNDGSGSFALAVSPDVHNLPQAVVAADVNADGRMDLICANHDNSTNSLSVLLNTTTFPPPLLKIHRSGNSVIVLWPSPSSFKLQVNTNVATTNWSDVGGSPLDDGTNNTVIVSPPTGNHFYRLFKP